MDNVRSTGQVRMAVDYSSFRHAFGGDWASRLRLVSLPECALSTPDLPECRAAEVAEQRNDNKSGSVSGDVSADGGLFAITAGVSGSTGDYKATNLSPSATWSAGGSSGDFTWSYPLRVPPSTGGQAPELGLAYSSGSIDGRTASTNNQPTWVGEGFDLPVGHVERRYKGCADDLGGNNGQTKTGDLCWATDNAFVSLGGKASELIRDDHSGVWRLKNDDGSKVDRLTDSDNGDDNHEYWRITTNDGIQYFFGQRGASNSTWTVPVFGNNLNEPCNKATFAASWCYQAYRWNLDRIVDPRGNTTTFYYRTESNLYGLNLGQTGTSYHRGGWLESIEYGTHAQAGGAVPAVVRFTPEDRCVNPGATCVSSNPGNWPDVPWDQQCNSGNCSSNISPTFWTAKRLAKITTQIWGGTSYRDVDTWTLVHRFLNPGDNTSAALWLEAIRHNGGGTNVPEVNFNETPKANRVDGHDENILPLVRYRVSSIANGTGGTLAIEYSTPQCNRISGPMPSAPEWNTLRCFPSFWTPAGGTQPTMDWFHKYVVTSVTESDHTGGARPKLTSYEYLSDPAWHYDDEDGLVPVERKTWSQWRGHRQVGVITGDTTVPRTRTVTTYLQGMDDDRLPGGRRNVLVPDADGGTVEDHEPFQGMAREQITYQAAGDNTIVSAQVTEPWLSTATATNSRPWGAESAFLVDSKAVRNRVALKAGGFLRTEVINTFEQGTGLLLESSDLGNTSTPTDDRCTRTTYARNTTAWMLDFVSRVESVGVACTAPVAYPQDLLTDVRTHYDNGDFGVAPTRGLVTRTEQAASWSNGKPRYVTVSRAAHDMYGRVTESWDSAGERLITAYMPSAGGPVVGSTVTNPLGHSASTELDPAWGLPTRVTDANRRKTEVVYDGLGRLLKVWLPGRSRTDFPSTPNTEVEYRVRTTAANLVITKSLRPDGSTYNHGYAFFDGLVRSRQTQVASPGLTGGRIISESFFDSRGLVWKSSGPYFNGAPPDVNMVTPVNDKDVPTQTLTAYDGAARVIASIFRINEVEQWRTTTSYGGDRVHVNPPAGATATTTITNARGKPVELRQYTGAAPSTSFQATKYTYTDRDELASVTDPANNVWTYSYDLRGLKIGSTDPDKGATTSTFDDAGRLRTTTDARNVTLAYAYDRLGRKTAVHEGSLTGTKRAEWTFDTAPGGVGMPASSTRFDGGQAYVSAVDGYDSGGRPTGSTVTVPAAEGSLAGTYRSTMTYHPDGSPATVQVPAAGGLSAETLSFGYNTLGLPAKLTSGSASYVTETGYSDLAELGQLTLQRTPTDGKAWQTFFYEVGTRRLSQFLLERQTSDRQQANLAYQYDQAGNLVRLTDLPAAPGRAHDRQCFRYDHVRRLTEAWSPGSDDCGINPTVAGLGGPAPYWHSYRYDAVGNRTSEVQHSASGDTTRTYTYPSPGGVRPHTLRSVSTAKPGTAATTDTFGYNETGDTTSRALAGQPTHTLTWDPEDRLASDMVNGQTTSFVYTPDGARLLRRDPTHTTLYLPDGTELRWQRSGTTVVGTRYYTHAGRTVAVRQGSTLTWLAADHHNTAMFAVDAATLNVTRRRWLPFGQLRGTQPSWPGERGFVGGTIDSTTGLTHLGARDYDPATGRFISVDPIMDLADPQQMHGYTYANNNPLTYTDPAGLKLFEDDNTSVDSGHHGGGGKSSGGSAPAGGAADPVVKYDSKHVKAVHDPVTGKNWINYVQLPDELNFDQVIALMHEFLSDEDNWSQIRSWDQDDPLITNMAVLTMLTGICSKLACGGGRGTHYKLMQMYWASGGAQIGPQGGAAGGGRAGAPGGGGRTGMGHTHGAARPVDVPTSIRAKLCPNGRANSFVPGTPVLMAAGTHKPIEDVQVGDTVLATDPETGRTEPQEVVATIVGHGDKNLVEITIDTDGGTGNATGVVIATTNHPVWIDNNRGWVDAGNLKPGDTLRTPTGRHSNVITLNKYNQIETVYNLTVGNTHTYYVAASSIASILVHNSGCTKMTSAIGNDPLLVKAAEQAGRNQAVQREMDNLSGQLAAGNMNPGIGTKSLTGTGISYARGANGARLFFRSVDGGIQIVAKADKATEARVIGRLTEIYGG